MKRSEFTGKDTRLRALPGQSLIEASMVIFLMSFIFMGLFQVSQLHMANEVMVNAAAAGARSKAVGFNDFMLYKVVNIATIPNAGRMENPNPGTIPLGYVPGRIKASYWNDALANDNPYNPQTELEISSIPLYLGTDSWGGLPGVLDYEDWDTVRQPYTFADGEGALQVSVRQDFPLDIPLRRAFYRDDEVRVERSATNGDFGAIFLQ